jgi:hypothetical protein
VLVACGELDVSWKLRASAALILEAMSFAPGGSH